MLLTLVTVFLNFHFQEGQYFFFSFDQHTKNWVSLWNFFINRSCFLWFLCPSTPPPQSPCDPSSQQPSFHLPVVCVTTVFSAFWFASHVLVRTFIAYSHLLSIYTTRHLLTPICTDEPRKGGSTQKRKHATFVLIYK